MKKHVTSTFVLILLSACGTQPGAVYFPQGPKGDSGETGVAGRDGSNGADGIQGTPGLNGSNGQDATPVTVVQFCTGYTPTYPASFPESALCVQGNLWATFWMGNSAWSGIVPPGTYNSTSTGAPCTFTVAANCVVTN